MKGCGGEGLGFGDFAGAGILRSDGSESGGVGRGVAGRGPSLGVGGFFTVECIDKDGNTRWVEDLKNGVVNSALDDVLNVYLANTSAATPTWYIGLVDNAGYTQFATTDTIASHAGWAENQQYSQANRLAWGPGGSNGQSVTNATSVNFSMTATATIRGLFLVSDSTKGGTAGKLFSTAAFSGGNQVVNNGDTLKVTYTVSASSS